MKDVNYLWSVCCHIHDSLLNFVDKIHSVCIVIYIGFYGIMTGFVTLLVSHVIYILWASLH